MILHMAALGIGFLMDWCLGDPLWLPHPVRCMGRMIGRWEQKIRKASCGAEQKLLTGGACLAFGLPVFWCLGCLSVCLLCYRIHWMAGLAVESFCCYQMLAGRGLYTESMKVYDCLKNSTLEEAKGAVSMIVGRDTGNLDEAGVARAAVETVAENFSDGVAAPMLYMALLGAPGGYWYKCVNTLDSMIGYKDERFAFLGRCSARLDDWANYIPSRLAALFMVAASGLSGLDRAGAWRIWRRDKRNHASPNSAQTEAAAAGALGIRLAGPAWYFGKRYEKPYIGDDKRPVSVEDIRRVNRLMILSSWIMMALLQVCYWIGLN